MITKECPACQAKMTPAKTEAQANRTLGLHLRHAHGIAGGYNPKRKHPRRGRREQPESSGSLAGESIKLPECPCCGARFYAVKHD